MKTQLMEMMMMKTKMMQDGSKNRQQTFLKQYTVL
jgi:hypothetical protein